jgi:hypothetical protein
VLSDFALLAGAGLQSREILMELHKKFCHQFSIVVACVSRAPWVSNVHSPSRKEELSFLTRPPFPLPTSFCCIPSLFALLTIIITFDMLFFLRLRLCLCRRRLRHVSHHTLKLTPQRLDAAELVADGRHRLEAAVQTI